MKQIVTIMCPYVDECRPTGEFYIVTGQFKRIHKGWTTIEKNGYIYGGKDIQLFIF